MALAKELKKRAEEARKKEEDEKWKPYQIEIDELFEMIVCFCKKAADEGKEDLLIDSSTYPELWKEIYILDPQTGEYSNPCYTTKVSGKLVAEGFRLVFNAPCSKKEDLYLRLWWDIIIQD